MALTKHQRLARAITQRFDCLDSFYGEVVKRLDVIQFHFYEKWVILGRPLMSKRALNAMMCSHKQGLGVLASNLELRKQCVSKPLIGVVISPSILLFSKILSSPPDNTQNARWVIPWGVKICLPQDTLQLILKGRDEAILYCATDEDMTEWLDSFEREDMAGTLTNRLHSVFAYEDAYNKERSLLEKNMKQLAYPHFVKMVIDYEDKDFSSFLKKNATVEESYFAVTHSLKSRKERYHDSLKIDWKDRLEELMFEGLHWSQERQEGFLKGLMGSQIFNSSKGSGRWQTGRAIDRGAYSSFIQYFSKRFLENPNENKVEGEIVCLLWIIVYVTQDTFEKPALQSFLDLTTAHIEERTLNFEGQKIDLSIRLARIIHEYIGKAPKNRQKRLFPHLTIDKLEDRFRKASKELLSPDSLPILPEAFLTFPHNLKGVRMVSSVCRNKQLLLPKIYDKSISRREIARQLREKTLK